MTTRRPPAPFVRRDTTVAEGVISGGGDTGSSRHVSVWRKLGVPSLVAGVLKVA